MMDTSNTKQPELSQGLTRYIKPQKYVIGGGIAGLSWLLYNPEYICLTDNIGGQFSERFQLGPKYLHVTPKTEIFMKDLELSPKKRVIKVGFWYNGAVHPTNTEENRKRYFEKTRGLSSEPYRSSMSEGSTEFAAFDIGVKEIVDRLTEKLSDRIIIEKLTALKWEFDMIVTDKSIRNYSDLVVTIPRPIAIWLTGYPRVAETYKSYKTFFILSKQETPEWMQEYDYVYFSEPTVPYHRMTKTPQGVVYEVREDRMEEMDKMNIEYVDKIELKIGQIVQTEDSLMWPENVHFFGRFAEWKHGLKTKELIDRLIS